MYEKSAPESCPRSSIRMRADLLALDKRFRQSKQIKDEVAGIEKDPAYLSAEGASLFPTSFCEPWRTLTTRGELRPRGVK
jgi:hypothetical protein